MKYLKFLTVFCLVSLVLGGGYYWWHLSVSFSGVSQEELKLKVAPNFKLKTFDGIEVSLSSFKGQTVILHFWASWCGPCLEEMPALIAASKQWSDLPVVILAVSEDEIWKNAHKVLPHSSLSNHLVSVLDTRGFVSDMYGSYSFPESFLITPSQRIRSKWVGVQDWKSPLFRKWIEQLSENQHRAAP